MDEASGRGYLQSAREAFAARDWSTARAHFLSGGALSTEDLSALRDACWWLGRADEYVEHGTQLHERLRHDGASARAALVALELGFTESARGHGDIGAAWMARARRLFSDVSDAPEVGYLLAIDADHAAAAGEVDAAEKLTDRVRDLGERHGVPTLQAMGLFLAGTLALRRDQVTEGLRLLDEAMLPVLAGQVRPEWAGNLYCRMMQVCYQMGDLPRARHWTAVTEQWCHGYAPAVVFTGICRVHRADLLQIQGEWTSALTEAQRASEDLDQLDVVVAAEARYRIGEICRLRGDLEGAETAYRQAHASGRDPLPGLALLHLRRGRKQVAAAVLDAALAAASTPLGRAPLLGARAEIALAGADPRHAEQYIDDLAGIAEQYNSPGWRAEARRWRGAFLLATHHHAAAVRTLREAQAHWQQIGAPYRVARIRIDLADAYDALADHDTATRERQEAALVLEHLGARHELDRIRSRLRPRRAPEDLSPRELDVVVAIADGSTNRQAARRLHISERTVARHLANAYLKAGVSSRTAIVAWARDRGML